jgi:hypothetical protein
VRIHGVPFVVARQLALKAKNQSMANCMAGLVAELPTRLSIQISLHTNISDQRNTVAWDKPERSERAPQSAFTTRELAGKR